MTDVQSAQSRQTPQLGRQFSCQSSMASISALAGQNKASQQRRGNIQMLRIVIGLGKLLSKGPHAHEQPRSQNNS